MIFMKFSSEFCSEITCNTDDSQAIAPIWGNIQRENCFTETKDLYNRSPKRGFCVKFDNSLVIFTKTKFAGAAEHSVRRDTTDF